MKFSLSLQFNTVPEWTEHYLAYSNLKKLIYHIERGLLASENHRGSPVPLGPASQESSALLDASERANASFLPALDKELARITEFYLTEEERLSLALEDVESRVAAYETLPPPAAPMQRSKSWWSRRTSSTPLDAALLTSATRLEEGGDSGHVRRMSASGGEILPQHRPTDSPEGEMEGISTPEHSVNDLYGGTLGEDDLAAVPAATYADGQKLRAECVEIYVGLCELRGYSQLNMTGFRKILKKYDKLTRNNAQSSYLKSKVRPAPPFNPTSQAKLTDQIRRAEAAHMSIAGIASPEDNTTFLRKKLREQVVFGRNTVWRDMIAEERRVAAIDVMDGRTLGRSPSSTLPSSFSSSWGRRWTKVCGIPLPTHVLPRPVLMVLLSTVVFVVLLGGSTFAIAEEQRCFAILVYISLLWSTEAMPLFVTSLLVPLLVVLLGVMRDPRSGEPMAAPDAAHAVFGTMFSPVIMLLLGGFALAAALSKHHVAKGLAMIVLERAGTRPGPVLLANMAVACFASMWISNVAAPALCFSITQPILRTLPPDADFGRALVLGIALASNIGGMASPISSPQNVIAVETMVPPPSWLQWFAVSIPLCTVAILLTWALLMWHYRPTATTTSIHPLRASPDPITWTQVFVVAVSVGTVGLWCLEGTFHGLVGDMGVLAVIPLVAFFGTGILSKEDFNNFLWTVIVLAQGGIALGKAVDSSGLLHTIAMSIQGMVMHRGVWSILVIFTGLVLIVATFISHTVAALIVLPVVSQVGLLLPDPRPRLLVMGAALMCSGAMGLPVSGFPNMTAISLEDERGRPYLTTVDFLQTGVPASVLVLILIITLGFGIMFLLGF